MKKCPRCEKEVDDHEKFCPYCGLDLQGKYRPVKVININVRRILGLIVFFGCMSIPILYSQFLMNLGEELTQTNGKPIVLEEMEDTGASIVLARYTTLADFQNKFSNVDQVIQNISDYENNLAAKANHVFDKDYSIVLYDNYDIVYTLTYTTQINDNFKMIVQRTTDRSHHENEEVITFQKTGVESFEDLLLTEEEKEWVALYTGNQTVTEKLMDEFSLRKDEFDKKKDTLGHYGIGNYEGESSFVVHRQKKTYYSQTTYTQDVKDYIH